MWLFLPVTRPRKLQPNKKIRQFAAPSISPTHPLKAFDIKKRSLGSSLILEHPSARSPDYLDFFLRQDNSLQQLITAQRWLPSKIKPTTTCRSLIRKYVSTSSPELSAMQCGQKSDGLDWLPMRPFCSSIDEQRKDLQRSDADSYAGNSCLNILHLTI